MEIPISLQRAYKISLCLAFGAALLAQGNGCSGAQLALKTQTETVSLHILNYCPDATFSYSQAFANNQSAILTTTGWQPSTDRDFMTDAFKRNLTNRATYGFVPGAADSIQTGYRDGFLKAMGYVGGASRPASCAQPYVDNDGDGLYDCEELLLGASSLTINPDADGDGIPDGVEFRMGLNPLNANDAQIQSSAPGITNLMASYLHLLLNQTPTSLLSSLQYGYETTNLGGGCYSFRITNIPKMPVANGNMIETIILSNKLDHTANVNFVRVLVPASTINAATIVISTVANQTIDPRSTPLVFE